MANSLAFGIPIDPNLKGGKIAFIKHLVEEAAEHLHARSAKRGYDRIKVFHQNWPVEQVVIYLEAEDLHDAMAEREAEHEFEEWFEKRYEELTGHHVDHIQPHISDLVMDWHPEKGVSAEHH